MGGRVCASYKVGTLQRLGGGEYLCHLPSGYPEKMGVEFVPSTKWVLCKDGG